MSIIIYVIYHYIIISSDYIRYECTFYIRKKNSLLHLLSYRNSFPIF